MASVLVKVQKVATTLWDHKKKTVAAGIVLCVAGNYAATFHTCVFFSSLWWCISWYHI